MLQMEFLIDSRPAYCQILVNPWEVSLYEPEVHLLNLEPVLGAGHRLEDIIEMPDEPVALLEGRLVLSLVCGKRLAVAGRTTTVTSQIICLIGSMIPLFLGWKKRC